MTQTFAGIPQDGTLECEYAVLPIERWIVGGATFLGLGLIAFTVVDVVFRGVSETFFVGLGGFVLFFGAGIRFYYVNHGRTQRVVLDFAARDMTYRKGRYERRIPFDDILEVYEQRQQRDIPDTVIVVTTRANGSLTFSDSLSNYRDLAHILQSIGRQTPAPPLHRQHWFLLTVLFLSFALVVVAFSLAAALGWY